MNARDIPGSAIAVARAAVARAWALRWRFLAIHAAFLLAGFAILSPLAGLAVQSAVWLSGAPVLADADIARFLISPVGFVAGLVAAGVVVALAALQVAVMMAADLDDRRRVAPSVLRAAVFATLRARRLVVLAGLLILRLLLIAAPFAIAGAVVVVPLLSAADVNYFLAERPPEAVRAAVILVLLGAAFGVVVAGRLAAWSLAPGAVLFGGVSPLRAFALSAGSSRWLRLRIAVAFALVGAAAVALGAAVLGAAGIAVRLVIAQAGDAGLGTVSAALLTGFAIWSGASVLAGSVTVGTLAAFLTQLHLETGGDQDAAHELALPRPAMEGARARALLGVAALVSCGAAYGGAALANAVARGDAVQVIAHRGASGVRPENTLAAFEHAIEAGADWIELDVQETADGAVVVIHDRDFMKLAGVPLRVHEATLTDLADIDIGSRFSPEFADQRTSTLREALELARGRVGVLIELKHYGFAVRLEERVAEVVEDLGMTAEVAIMSLDHASVARMRALRPGWRVGLLAAAAVGDLTRADADFLALRTAIATDALLARARRAGRPVLVWTVNDALSMSGMISRGAAGLITDEPALARQVLAERAEMGIAERLMLAAAHLFQLPVTVRSFRDGSP